MNCSLWRTAIVLALTGIATSANAADGDLDPLFDNDGVAFVGMGAGTAAYGMDVAIQPDGKIVVAGFVTGGGNTDFAVVRLLSNGQLDPGFGTGGRVRLPFDQVTNGADRAHALLLQDDGKIWVGGWAQSTVEGAASCAVARLLANGTPDDGFSGDGKRVFGGCSVVHALGQQSSGGLLLLGDTALKSVVCRLDATTGNADETFGSFGCRDVGGAGLYMFVARDLVVRGDDTLLAAGMVSANGAFVYWGVASLTADGDMNTDFGQAYGIDFYNLTNDWGEFGEDLYPNTSVGALTTGESGATYLVGNFLDSPDFYAASCQFDPDTGDLVTGYSQEGTNYFQLGDGGYARSFDAAVDRLGRVVVVGAKDGSYCCNGAETAVARLTHDGSPDNSFHVNGRWHVNLSSSGAEQAEAVAIPINGGIVVVGWEEGFQPTEDGGTAFITVLRLQSAPPLLFDDDFESRNTLAWDAEAPALESPDVFRWTDLDLREPHVYVQTLGCNDHTPHGASLFSVNDELAESLVTDADTDGYLDRTHLTLFRPLDPEAVGGRLDDGAARCVAPNPPASCDWTDRWNQTPLTFTYDTLPASGTCLEPIAATTNGGYSPAISTPTAPCFWAELGTVAIDFFGVLVPLQDAQVAAQFVGDPPTSLVSGLSMGFLTEADADAAILPGSLPLVGGQPLSILFPGGTGNCAAHDDRDTWNDQSGWWVYFNFVASPVNFVGR